MNVHLVLRTGLLLALLDMPLVSWASLDSTASCELPANFSGHLLVKQALLCSPALKAETYKVEAANLDVQASGRFPEPKLSLGVAPQTFDSEQLDKGYIVEVSQQLPWVGERALQRDLSNAQLAGQSQILRQSRIERAQSLRKLYAQWQFHRDLLAVNQRHQAIVDTLTALLHSRYSTGSSSKSALLQLEHEKLLVGQRSRELKDNLQNDALALQAASGLPNLRTRLAQRVDAETNEQLAANLTLQLPSQSLLDKAIKVINEQPMIALVRARQLQNEAQLALQKKDRLPELSVMTRYNSIWANEDQRWVVGVGINLPLDFSKRRHREDKLTAEAAALRYEHKDVQSLLIARLNQQFTLWRQTAEQLLLYEQQLLPLARQNFDAVRDDYRAGAVDYQSVLSSQERLVKTREKHLMSLRQWRESEADFIALSGQLFLEDFQP